MAVGNITLNGVVSGGPDGARTFGPVTITTNAAVTAETQVALVVGSVTLTVPVGASALVFFPPNTPSVGSGVPNPGFGGTITVKGAAGDTGVPVSASRPSVLTFDVAPSQLVFTSTAAGNALVWFM